MHGQRYAALSAPNPLTPSFRRLPFLCQEQDHDHILVQAVLKSGIIGGNVIGVTATTRIFLPISARWQLVPSWRSKRVSDICGALPPANYGESGPVGQSHGFKSAKLNPSDRQHTGHCSDPFLFIFASLHIFWVDLTYTLKWQLGKSLSRDCTRSLRDAAGDCSRIAPGLFTF